LSSALRGLGTIAGVSERNGQAIMRRCERWLAARRPATAAELLRAAADALPEDAQPDRHGEGEYVEAFERRIAERLGKEAAALFPTGTMTQQVALRLHCDRRQIRTVAFHPTPGRGIAARVARAAQPEDRAGGQSAPAGRGGRGPGGHAHPSPECHGEGGSGHPAAGPLNRRIHVVELTEAGDRAFLALREAAIAFDRRLRDGIPEPELEAFEALLDRLAGNVTELGLTSLP
jgi:Beta-eliminating lyase